MVFADLLRCIVVFIYHIQISFVHTNAIETIVGVGAVSPPSNNKYCKKNDFRWAIKTYS